MSRARSLLMLSFLMSLPTALRAEELQPGCIREAEIGKRDAELKRALPEPSREVVEKRFPKAKLVESCGASFSTPSAKEHFVTLLDPAPGSGRLRVVRALVLADGTVEVLDWSSGPDWKYSENVDSCDKGAVFYGEQRCLQPSELDAFLKDFFKGFQKKVKNVNPRKQTSACFSFDSTYNNWQCFAFEPKSRKFVRWGYQAVAD